MTEEGLDTLLMRGALEERLFGARPAELTIGRFYVLDRLGQGGMGVVYAVYDEELDRRVALKLLKGDGTIELRQRLQREARAMAQLSHPNVVPVFEVGEHDGQLYIVLEYVRGQTLRQWVTHERRRPEEIIERYVQAGRGLAAAHAAGIVHRDFKPDNAIVGTAGRVRVLDFGLARKHADLHSSIPAVRETPTRDASLDTPLTETGSMVGTPAYMAPEQFTGRALDHRTDQFAFCVALWEALCDVRPYAGTTVESLASNVVAGELQLPPRDKPLPGWLRRILERGLQPDPDARWPSMDALLERVEAEGKTGRRSLRRGAAAAVVLTAVGGAIWAQATDDEDECDEGPALLAQVWDEPRRAEVAQALAGVDAVYAVDTAARVDALLGEYADSWAAGHRDACEASRVRGLQSTGVTEQRMRCLQHRWRALGALLDVLAKPDISVLEAAVRSTTSLPAVGSCSDLSYVTADVPPPDDATLAAEVERVEEDLAHAHALVLAGKAAQALAVAEGSLKAAHSLDYPPLLVHASTEVAQARNELGRYDEAIEVALQGFEVSDLGGPQAAAQNLIELGSSLHSKSAFTEALAYRRKAVTILGRLHHAAHTSVGIAHGGVADTLAALGRYDEAEESARTMLGILEDALPDDHADVGQAHGRLGTVLGEQGKYEDSIVHKTLALEIAIERLGPDHPLVAAALVGLGITVQDQGRIEDALPWFEDGLVMQLRVFGPDHPEVGTTHNNIAVALERLGKSDEARARYELARDIWTRSLGERHLNVGIATLNIGETYRSQGRLEEALAQYEKALEIKRAVLGDDHPQIASAHVTIGYALSGLRRDKEALTHYEEGLRLQRAAFGDAHWKVASTLEAMGSSLVGLHRNEEGIERLEESLATYARMEGEHPSAGWTHLAMGRAIWLTRGCVHAIEHFEAAAEIWMRAHRDTHPYLARPLTAIARCEDRPDAAERARTRLRAVAEAEPDDPVVKAHLAVVEAGDDGALDAARRRLDELGEWIP